MRDYDRLVGRLRELQKAGHTAAQVADHLNHEGFHPTGRRTTFSAMTVRQLLSRWQLSGERHEAVTLGRDEWWLNDLARVLTVSAATVRRWIARRWVHCRRSPQHGYHLLWADADELERLRHRRDQARNSPEGSLAGRADDAAGTVGPRWSQEIQGSAVGITEAGSIKMASPE